MYERDRERVCVCEKGEVVRESMCVKEREKVCVRKRERVCV